MDWNAWIPIIVGLITSFIMFRPDKCFKEKRSENKIRNDAVSRAKMLTTITSIGAFDNFFPLHLRGAEISEEEKVRSRIHSTFTSIEIFVNKIEESDSYYEAYSTLLELYEPYLKSLAKITNDDELLNKFKNDLDMMTKFHEALKTLDNDLKNIRDNYVTHKYKEITSFL